MVVRSGSLLLFKQDYLLFKNQNLPSVSLFMVLKIGGLNFQKKACIATYNFIMTNFEKIINLELVQDNYEEILYQAFKQS